MANPNIVLVTGATGQQGGAVAHELLAHGYPVRAMTRKPDSDKAKALAMLGAELIQGDLDDAPSLERALKGVWGVFALQNTWEAGVEREEAQGKRLAELARRAGVQHYVYSSVGSAHLRTGIPHFDNKWRVEETVRGLGFPSWVILRPVFFMDNLLSPWFKPALDQGKLAVALLPTTVLQMVAVPDIGKYGLLAFQKGKELSGRAIDFAGDAKTMPEVAAILSKVSGRPIVFERLPIETVRQASADFAAMLEWFDKVGYTADIQANARLFGIPPTKFDEWAGRQKWN